VTWCPSLCFDSAFELSFFDFDFGSGSGSGFLCSLWLLFVGFMVDLDHKRFV
jgi:hypothetical protein